MSEADELVELLTRELETVREERDELRCDVANVRLDTLEKSLGPSLAFTRQVHQVLLEVASCLPEKEAAVIRKQADTLNEAAESMKDMFERPSKIVTIYYFKPTTGKFYTTESATWYRDPDHFDGWMPFDKVARIQGLDAVCIDTPFGVPVMRRGLGVT